MKFKARRRSQRWRRAATTADAPVVHTGTWVIGTTALWTNRLVRNNKSAHANTEKKRRRRRRVTPEKIFRFFSFAPVLTFYGYEILSRRRGAVNFYFRHNIIRWNRNDKWLVCCSPSYRIAQKSEKIYL